MEIAPIRPPVQCSKPGAQARLGRALARGVAKGLFFEKTMRSYAPLSTTALAPLLLAAGCATDAGAATNGLDTTLVTAAAELTLEPPARGVQVETLGSVIDPGEDARWCEVIALPGTVEVVYPVDRIETAVTAFARGVVVSAAPIGSDVEGIMDVGARVPCTRAGDAFGEGLAQLVELRHRYGDQRYPAGVGQILHGGQRLVVEIHSLNEGEEPILAKAKLNFHTTEPGAIGHVARTASFENVTIYTPPRGSSSHLAECAVSQPIWVSELVRRTEQHGTTFSVWLHGGARDGMPLWTSAVPDDGRWEPVEPILIDVGEGFRFQCDYQNSTDFALRFGVSASDETCALSAIWWPASNAETRDEGCLLFEVAADGIAR